MDKSKTLYPAQLVAWGIKVKVKHFGLKHIATTRMWDGT